MIVMHKENVFRSFLNFKIFYHNVILSFLAKEIYEVGNNRAKKSVQLCK